MFWNDRASTDTFAIAPSAKWRRVAIACLSIPVITCGTSNANEKPNDEIMVLGTRLSVESAPTLEVIDKEQIESSSVSTISDLLRQLPGVTSIEPGGAGGISEVYLRGADANFTTVFIDGVQMNNPTDPRGGAFDFTTVLPEEVDRIEVVKGPFSALYGSGALAGAINLVTRPASLADRNGVVHGSIGSNGYRQAGVELQGESDTAVTGLSINHVDFGESTERSQRTVSSLGTYFDAELGSNLWAELTFRAMRSDRAAFPVASGGPKLATTEILETADAQEVILAGTLRWQSERHEAIVRVNYLNSDGSSTTDAIPDGVFSGTPRSESSSDFDRLQAMLHSRVLLSDSIELGAGLEYQHDEGSALGALDFGFVQLPTEFRQDRDTISPFVEGRFELLPSVSAYGALRYDDYSDGDSSLSPRFGAEFRHQRSNVNLNVSWGEARKKPSFYALGDPLVGNPNLEPEDSSGYEVWLESPVFTKGVTFSIGYFNYKYKNLIDFDFSAFSLVNRSSVEIDGAEIRVDSDTKRVWNWSVFVSSQQNLVDGVQNSLLHRPELSAGAIVNWVANEKWRSTISANFEGARRSSSIPGGETTVDPYVRVNLAVTRTFSKDVEVALSIDNILSKNYEVVAGFSAAGRQIRIGARLAL